MILALWGLPLFLGPPVFSRDLYSYIAQGLLAHHGLNPYHVAPSSLGWGPLLSSIASVWRNTASPYGPLFVMVSRAAVSVAGSSLVAQILVFRQPSSSAWPPSWCPYPASPDGWAPTPASPCGSPP